MKKVCGHRGILQNNMVMLVFKSYEQCKSWNTEVCASGQSGWSPKPLVRKAYRGFESYRLCKKNMQSFLKFKK